MSALIISLIAFACIFGGTLLGMFLRTILPGHHVSDDSKGAVMLGTGMIATMAALVLALLIASAKGNYDTMSSELRQASSRVILLDRVMAHYGPETNEARDLLRRSIASTIKRIWPEDNIEQAVAESTEGRVNIETIQDKLRQLSPRNDAQRWLQSRALEISSEIAEGRWLLIEQLGQRTLPMPFFVLMVFWLTIIFASFGLFSPRNATVITVLLICALSAAGSLFLIIELDTPYQGLIKVSSAPLRNALAHLGQ
ncbi:MAG: hypothetical protein ABSA04_03125 [Desulfobaccales bacterium]